MKSVLLAASAILLGATTHVIGAPTRAAPDNFCVGERCVYTADNVDTPFHSAVMSKNDLATTGDTVLGVMLVKPVECGINHECPLGYLCVQRSEETCWCFPSGGDFKHDVDILTQDKAANPQTAADPHLYCANALEGHCLGGTVALWGQRGGRCYCGPPQADTNLSAREVEDPTNPFRKHRFCAQMLERRCPQGKVGDWDENGGHCFCRPAANNESISGTGPTTAGMLIRRLLPEDLKFPSGISAVDWNAIQVTLLLLDGVLESQSDLHQVCTGAKDPAVFGFKLETFRKICTPEIKMAVSVSEVAKAQMRISSAIFIDNKLLKYNNNFSDACEEVQGVDAISPGLERGWILSQLCIMGM